MFKKSNTAVDVRKSQQKCIDIKKDTPTRLKHLKTVFENCETSEIRSFLESNYSIVFHLIYDAFLAAEHNLKQKGAFAVQRSYREELEHSLFFFDRILCFLPELIRQRWQCNACTHIFKKILHHNNTVRLRREAMRLFILWYSIVGENRSEEMDCMFASLVDGFPVPPPPVQQVDSKGSRVTWIEPTPVIASSSAEKAIDDYSAYMLRFLLEFIVSQIRRVEWKDKVTEQPRAFCFVFERFKYIYLPYIFPNFNPDNSIYTPNLDLPELRTTPSVCPFGSCPVVLVEWVKKYITPPPKKIEQQMHSSLTQGEEDGRKSSYSENSHEMASTGDQDSVSSAFYANDEASAIEDLKMVRDMLFSSRENVNFVHEIFRQTLRLCFRYSVAMKTVIHCYCDWIKMASNELPAFMLEPLDRGNREYTSDVTDGFRRLRTDSYVGAINSEIHVRAGLQNVLQVFITSAANVFLLVVSPDFSRLLDEQVDLCKLVLNIYRYMVMNSRMEQKTWEQLLIVLFHITSQTLSGKSSVKHKGDSLGRRFAAALFQTLIVSWIKANLSVVISGELWDQLLTTLASLTHWEELIKEWAKTMDTLTKVLARHVYELELNNLPLDRLTERKALKKGAGKLSVAEIARNNLSKGWNQKRGPEISQSSTATGQNSTNTCDGPKRDLDNRYMSSNSRYFKGSAVTSSSIDSYRAIRRGRQGSGDCSADFGQHHQRHDSEISYKSSYEYHHHRKNLSKWSSDPLLSGKPFAGPNRLSHMLCYSRSADCVAQDDLSRSPSPAMSSEIDSSCSIRDNPMPIYLGTDSVSLDTLEDSVEHRSVMSGGTVRGWLPDVSVVLWRRVLGLLGDPNDVSFPHIHEQIFKYLLELTDTLIKLRDNQGVSIDNQSTPEPSELVPPLTITVPWCFKAFALPNQYLNGKLLAYQLLFRMLVRSQDVTLPKDVVAQFYRVLHFGLVGHELDVTSTLMKGCSPNFFSVCLPGSSVLALDFIFGANILISSPDSKASTARFDAISLLGSLYPIISSSSSMPVLQPHVREVNLIQCSEVKDHLVHVLLKCGRKEAAWKTRSQALLALSLFIYHELCNELSSRHPKVVEAIELILASLKIGKFVSQVASDLLLLLADHSSTILDSYPELPVKILQVICRTLSIACPDPDFCSKEGQHLLLSLMLCLGEWVMSLPQSALMQSLDGDQTLLQLVFQTLQMIEGGSKPSPSFIKTTKTDIAEIERKVKDEPATNVDTLTMASKLGSLRRGVFNGGFNATSVQLAARAIMSHFVNHLWQFPLGVGAQRLSSLVSETDDLPDSEISSDALLSFNVQFFSLNKSCVLSFIQLPSLQTPGGAASTGFKTSSSEVRLIIRDLSGKFCWDASPLFAPPTHDVTDNRSSVDSVTGTRTPSPVSPPLEAKDDMTSSLFMPSSMSMTSPVPASHPVRHRPLGVLPTLDDSADDLDNLDDLLSYIGLTSPELSDQFGQELNAVIRPPVALSLEAQNEAISSILSQRNAEHDYLIRHSEDANMVSQPQKLPKPAESSDYAFHQCRKLFDQLGWASVDKRKSIFTLRKNEKLIREIRNLDNQKCRDTHKLAVIYVAEGQEDKVSILNNSGGSEGFEEFVSGLGWEVELASHSGFMGGLQRNGATGDSAPYFATSLTEVIFHVSTRMPSSSEESSFQKMRHLGNDEVHIVWSEHRRDYRRGIIPTEFCDVLIIIYPLPNTFYRIQICAKPDIPFFGPLFDGAVIRKEVLPKLVKATALNASRAKRSRLPYYQQFYEERARSLETIIEQHSESTTFENFVSDVFLPMKSSATSKTSLENSDCVSSSTLASALLDRSSESNQRVPMSRPTSYSVGEHHNARERVRHALSTDSSSSHGTVSPYSSVNLSAGSTVSPSISPATITKIPRGGHQRKQGLVTASSLGNEIKVAQPVNRSSQPQSPNVQQPLSSRVPFGASSPVAPPRKSKDAFLYPSSRPK